MNICSKCGNYCVESPCADCHAREQSDRETEKHRKIIKEQEIQNIEQKFQNAMVDFSVLREILESYKTLLSAIRTHYEAKGQDRCFENDDKLYELVGLKPPNREIPSKDEWMAGCELYYHQQSGTKLENHCSVKLAIDQERKNIANWLRQLNKNIIDTSIYPHKLIKIIENGTYNS